MMRCVSCGSNNVLWHRLGTDFPFTRCADCGDRDCHEREVGIEEGDRCGRDLCNGVIEPTLPEPCSCSTSPMPPCGSCTSSFLACSVCGVVTMEPA
jgi:hypothetical protein